MTKNYNNTARQTNWGNAALVTLLGSALCLFGYMLFGVIVIQQHTFDTSIQFYFAVHKSLPAVHAIEIMTFFGSAFFLLPAHLSIVLFFLIKNNNRKAFVSAIVPLSGTAVLHLLKYLVKRQRPGNLAGEVSGYSFPSGHVFSSFIFCSILAYILWHSQLGKAKKWTGTILLLLFSLSIGISRLVLNAHYASDIIGGFCLSIIWIIGSYWVTKKYLKQMPVVY